MLPSHGVYSASSPVSARLDFYRFGGDSLQGRYHYLRLHPLSAAELQANTPADLKALIELGGFPESFFPGSADEARRWSREHREFLLQEELQGLERVQDIGQLEFDDAATPATGRISPFH